MPMDETDLRFLFTGTGGAFSAIIQHPANYPALIDIDDVPGQSSDVSTSASPKGDCAEGASTALQPCYSHWSWGLSEESHLSSTSTPPTLVSYQSSLTEVEASLHPPPPSCGKTISQLQGKGASGGLHAGSFQSANNTGNSGSRNSIPPNQSPTSSRKRAKGEAGRGLDSHMNTSEQDELPHKSRKAKPSAEERSRVILACPFYKRDPARYRSCRRFFLTKISYVKQHILRSHRMPPHCQICNRLFQTDEQQLEHVRSQTCDRQPYRPPEGVTQAQIALLRGRVDQKKSLEGQWYEIYEILFPGAQRPSSVYLDPELSQDLDEFTNFLTSRGPAILLSRVNFGSVVRSAPSGESLASEVSSALQEVYDEWYRTRTRDAPEPTEAREDPAPSSASTTLSTAVDPGYTVGSGLTRPSVLAQPSDRPLPFTTFSASSSSAFDRPTATVETTKEHLPPAPLAADSPSHLRTTCTPSKRSGESGQGGEHQRKSPRPVGYTPGSSSGPGSLAEREGIGPPQQEE